MAYSYNTLSRHDHLEGKKRWIIQEGNGISWQPTRWEYGGPSAGIRHMQHSFDLPTAWWRFVKIMTYDQAVHELIMIVDCGLRPHPGENFRLYDISNGNVEYLIH